MSQDGASYRAAGRRLRRARRRQAPGDGQGAVDLAAARRARAAARSTPRAASPRSCSSWTGARSRSSSRGSARSRSSPARCSSTRGQPLRRRRLRHGRRDRQRPLLRRRAAARRQRVLRDRRVGVVPRRASARQRCSRAGAAPAPTPAARGEGASRRRCRACSTRATSSSPAPPSAPCPTGRSPILGERLAAGDEIVLVASSGLHANGASLARLRRRARCPTATRPRCRSGADASARRCSSRR